MKLNTEVKRKLLNLVALAIDNSDISICVRKEKGMYTEKEYLDIEVYNNLKNKTILELFVYSEDKIDTKQLDECIEKLKEV